MADAPVADVIEADLDHELRPQLDPLELLLALPAAGVAVPALARLVRRELGDQRALLRRAQARRVADDVQLAVVVVEPQDQRADRPGLLAGAIADDDRVDRAHAA